MKKCILITGSTGDLGRSLAEHYAQKKIKLILTGRDQNKLMEVKRKIGGGKAEILISQMDFNHWNAAECIQNLGVDKIDGLVLIPPKIPPSTDCLPPSGEWVKTFNTVFVEPLAFLGMLLPLLLASGRSKVVVISGISSKVFLNRYAMNGAIRAAWHAQVKAMASQYGEQKIHINTLSFGGILTETFIKSIHMESEKTGRSAEDILSEKTGNVPLKKYATLQNVCDAVEGLLGNFSDHITGNNIVCDGGFISAY